MHIFLLNEVQFDCAKLFPDGEHIGCERGEGQVGLPLIESHGLQVARCLEPLAIDEEQALVRPQLQLLLPQREHPGVQSDPSTESCVLEHPISN